MAVAIVDGDEIAWRGIPFDARYGTGEDPGMAVFDGFLAALLED